MVNGALTRRSRPKDAVFGEWRAPDGWSIRRMDWLQPAPDAARGSLLFAGGRGDFIEKYLEAYAHWHGQGWNVAAFDWRGQGGSRGNVKGGNLTSFDSLIGDLAVLIDDWRADHRGPHAAIGHSMGGHLVLRTLVDERPALDAAVLVAPMIRVNSAPLSPSFAPFITDLMCLIGWRDQPMLSASDRAKASRRRQQVLTASRERFEDELWWWEQEPGFSLGTPSWGWMRAAYRSAAAAFTPEKLRSVDLPVLVIGTDRDRLVSPAATRSAAALLPKGELHMYADAAHEILREVDPVRTDALTRIDAFLDRHAR